jgi:hypothetical protein
VNRLANVQIEFGKQPNANYPREDVKRMILRIYEPFGIMVRTEEELNTMKTYMWGNDTTAEVRTHF